MDFGRAGAGEDDSVKQFIFAALFAFFATLAIMAHLGSFDPPPSVGPPVQKIEPKKYTVPGMNTGLPHLYKFFRTEC